ncbi:MAG TPA: extracellular solute-binding protein [Streptosporangiales bacterium]
MKTRREFLKVSGLAAGAAMLAGCSGGSGKGTTTINFLHNETDPPSVEFFKKAISKYEDDHPSVKVDMQLVSTDGRLQRLKSLQSARQMPGVFKIVPEERYTFATAGVIEPIDDIIDDIGRSQFVEQFIVPIKGKHYDIPYTINQFTIYMYRKHLLQQAHVTPATTWDEFVTASKTVTSDKNRDGRVDNFGTVIPASQNRMTDIYFAQVFWSQGGTYFDENYKVSLDADDAAVRALEILQGLARYSPPGIKAYSYSDMVSTYLTGKVVQDVYAPRLAANLADEAPQILKDTGTAPRPKGTSGLGIGYANPNSFVVSSKKYGNDDVDAAKEFLRYLVSPEQVAGFSRTAYPHMIPPLKSVQQRLLKEKNTMNSEHADLAKAAFDLDNTMDFTTEAGAHVAGGKLATTGDFNRYSPLITSRQISAGMVQDVLVRRMTPKEAVQKAVDALKSAVKESA